jgi:hypothetical protein
MITANVSLSFLFNSDYFMICRAGSSEAVHESAVKKRKNVGYEFVNFSNW